MQRRTPHTMAEVYLNLLSLCVCLCSTNDTAWSGGPCGTCHVLSCCSSGGDQSERRAHAVFEVETQYYYMKMQGGMFCDRQLAFRPIYPLRSIRGAKHTADDMTVTSLHTWRCSNSAGTSNAAATMVRKRRAGQLSDPYCKIADTSDKKRFTRGDYNVKHCEN